MHSSVCIVNMLMTIPLARSQVPAISVFHLSYIPLLLFSEFSLILLGTFPFDLLDLITPTADLHIAFVQWKRNGEQFRPAV